MTSIILTHWMIANIYAVMRHSKEEKAKSRERIVDVAARRIREAGLDGPGVAEIMQEAGMTHGGFYKHFGSRDDLLEAAVERAMLEPDQKMKDVISSAADPLRTFVDWYLSAEHVSNPGRGCGVAALGGDIAHSDDRLRTPYRSQVERYLATLEGLLGNRERANVALATLIGAVTIARALSSSELADEIVRDVRRAVKAAEGCGPSE
jgi:TetR/AcrR family transcriptional regulator, transcriptional repressor for nem operon